MYRDAYARVAAYYDREYRSYRDDFPLYEHMARRLGSPFLELGCGTGRITRLLLEMELWGVAVDVSQPMLELAAKHLDPWTSAGKVRLVQADARDLQGVQGPFAWALFGLGTFGHLLGTEDQLRSLRSVAERLASGGRLVVDMPEPFTHFPYEPSKGLEVQWIDVEGGLMKLVHRVPHFEEQAEEVTVVYEDWGEGRPVERTVTRFTLRYLFPGEVTLLAKLSGLAVEALYGSYDLEPFGAGSDRLICVLRKP